MTSDKTTHQFVRLMQQLKILKKKPYVKIGILQENFQKAKITDDDTSVAITLGEVAVINEFGAPAQNIPERSFIRSTFDEKSEEWTKLSEKLIERIATGDMTVERALGIVGERVKSDIVNKIITLNTPPNKPQTIKRKGSSNPLIDTGQLKNSITYQVFV